jgi:hypothetical protein
MFCHRSRLRLAYAMQYFLNIGRHLHPPARDLGQQIVWSEATYGASILEWVRQTYEGRLNFGKVTSVVEDLTGNKPQTLETWVRANREAVLSASS